MKNSLVLGIFLASFFSAYASERILSYNDEIWIDADGSITVQEAITVQSEGRSIQRGIVREFPLTYRDRFGNRVRVDFQLESVTHNGNSIAYCTKPRSNGIDIYIGQADRYLKPGIHTFILTYRTKWQLGFFSDFDELYWNAVGTGWIFPIDAVRVIIHMPTGVPIEAIKTAAYTGSYGSADAHAHTEINNDQIVFESSRPLYPYQGFTVAVGWPKGFVKEPTSFERLMRFARDNIHLFLLFATLLILFLYYQWVYRKTRPIKGIVIPRFYPPEDLLPGHVRGLYTGRIDAISLAAEVTNLAVMGYVTINYEKGYWNSDVYTLKKEPVKKDQDELPSSYKLLLHQLFAQGPEVKLYQPHILHGIFSQYKARLYNFLVPFYTSMGKWIAYGTGIAGIGLFCIWLSQPSMAINIVLLSFIIFLVIQVVAATRLVALTQAGQQLKEEVEGFRLYLQTAESERMKIIGTPPTENPQLYETYLPYAIALGVEEAWTRKFAPVFAQMQSAGMPYVPQWYVGNNFVQGQPFNTSAFSSSLSRSFQSAVAASSYVPGTSSGSRGGGYSGGGGGGGGGRGW